MIAAVSRPCSKILLAAVTLLILIGLRQALAEVPDEGKCVSYANAIQGAALRREMFAIWTDALPCLILEIDRMSSDVTSVQATQNRKGLLQASIAIRAILDENRDQAVQQFRSTSREMGGRHNVDIISVFAYGARSDNHDLRVNTTPILGYVIENDTACVPMDHLYDPAITSAGRVNLLAVVSAFASRANQESVDNIRKLVAYMKTQPVGPQASEILNKILRKIDAAGFRAPPGTASDLASCKAYAPIWGKDNLKYP
jgi:hypothetical protein